MDAPNMTTSTAVATTMSGQPMLGPEEWKVMAHQATVLSNSRIVPDAYRGKPDEIIAAALMGRDLGLSVIQSLNGLHVIDGKVGMAAQTMMAVIRQRGHTFRIDECTNDRVQITGIRADTGDTFTFSWDHQDTKNAGLEGKANWKKYWRSMALARCVSQISRILYADVLLGAGYTTEEVSSFKPSNDIDVGTIEGEIVEPPVVNAGDAAVVVDDATLVREEPEPVAEAPAPAQAAPEPRNVVGAHNAMAEQQKLDEAAGEAAAAEPEQEFDTPTDLFVAQLDADAAAQDDPEIAAAALSGEGIDYEAPAPELAEVPEWDDETNTWSRHLPPHGFEYDRFATKNAPEAALSDDCTFHMQHTMVPCGYAPGGLQEAMQRINGKLKEHGPQKNAWAYEQMDRMNKNFAAKQAAAAKAAAAS